MVKNTEKDDEHFFAGFTRSQRLEMRASAKRMSVYKSFKFAYNTVADAIVMLTTRQYLLLYSLCFLLDHLLPSRTSTLLS